MKRLKPPTNSFGAVELNSRSLKIVLEESILGRQKLTRLFFTLFEDLAKKETVDKIKRQLSEAGIQLSSCLLSIPRHSVATRYLRLPAIQEEEVAKMIELQIPKLLPYAPGEIISSYRIINTDAQGYSYSLVVLVQQSLVRSYYSFMENIGIKPSGIILSSEGSSHWLGVVKKDVFKNESVVLVDVDTTSADIMLIRQGELIFTRTIARQPNENSQDSSWQNKLQDEINRTLETANKEVGLVKVNRLIFTGGLSAIRDLDKAFANVFAFPVEIVPALAPEQMSDASTISQAQQYTDVSFASLAGAALSRQRFNLDLLPIDIKARLALDKVHKQRRQLITSLILVIALLSGLFIKHIYDKSRLIRFIDQETKSLSGQVASNEQIAAHLETIRDQLQRPVFITELLKIVYDLTPSDVYLANLTVQQSKLLILKGETTQLSSVFNFVAKLEKSDYFTQVRIRFANKRKIRGIESVDFQIECGLKAK